MIKGQNMSNNGANKEELESGNAYAQQHRHGSWLANLYQSVFQIIISTMFFVLNVFQELKKSALGEKALHALGEVEEKLGKPIAASPKIRSPSDRPMPPAGQQIQASEQTAKNEVVDHTIVDLENATPISMEMPPTQISKQEELSQAALSIEPSSDQSKNTLVIKNLPFKFKPTDLDKLLSDYQAHPKNVRLLRDNEGRFTGMAFIRCPSKEEAQRLILTMHDLDIGGRNIQVEFKMKKKKRGKLTTSTDSVSSMGSSSDEALIANKLRTSGEYSGYRTEAPINTQTPVIVESTIMPAQHPSNISVTAPAPPERRMRKLAVSAENTSTKATGGEEKFKNPPQIRRKSTSMLDSVYTHSAMPRSLATASGPSVRPVRQPVGPDGKSNGFSDEYRKARNIVH
jgi:RNA recognition motif-containing protein